MIPNKAFQALACGTPLVTADTPRRARAPRRRRERSARPAGRFRRAGGRDAASGRRPGARAPVGDGGLRAYRERASEDVLGAAVAGADRRAPVRLTRPRVLLWAAMSRLCVGLRRSPSCAIAPSRRAGSTSATWSRRSGRPRTGICCRSRTSEESRSRGWPARRPDPGPLRAAVADLAEPEPVARHAGGHRLARGAAALLARAQAPGSERAGTRVLARVPVLSGDRVDDAERVPPGCLGVPPPALRDLVPRRRPAAPFRRLRAARGADARGDPTRRSPVSASGTRFRGGAGWPAERSWLPASPGRRSRSRS